MGAHERLKIIWTFGASHFWLELLVSSSISGFVDAVARFVKNKVTAYLAMLTNVVASASDSQVLDLWYIVELLSMAE